MRYWIEKVNPRAVPADNSALFDKAKSSMAALADEYETGYTDEPMISAELMRKFIAEIETARIDLMK